MRRLQYRIRRLTHAWRRLPDFVIVGAQKCGTTSLFNYLAAHPQTITPLSGDKELHFFDKYYASGLAFYRSQFPLRKSAKGAATLCYEATPSYMYFPLARRRLLCDLPHVPLIAILRNPVERAYSAYCHFEKMWVRDGHLDQPRSFSDAIRAEMQAMESGVRPGLDEQLALLDPWKPYLPAYLDRGIYRHQVEELLRLHGRELTKILSFENLTTRPQEVMDDVCSFLEIQPIQLPRYQQFNSSQDGFPPLEPADRTVLQEFFRPHNEELFDLLGERFDW